MERRIAIGIFRPKYVDHLPRWSRIFRSEETETNFFIWIPTEISGIFGIMESTQRSSINAVKTPKTLNCKGELNGTFKIIHFKKNDYKAHSKRFRLTFENWRVSENISSHKLSDSQRVSTLNRRRVFEVFCTSLWTLSQFLEWPRSVID